jgi:ADP-ribose 1''-phosphate phosphatase
MEIFYRKGSLFDAPATDTLLLHACNAQGMWGSGVAKEFARRYPTAYKEYTRRCLEHLKPGERSPLVGKFLIVEDGNQKIGCAITSHDYGPRVDSMELVLKATQRTVWNAVSFAEDQSLVIHSPKINSGLFKTPWELTEAHIIRALESHPSVEWHVWEL